MRTPTLLTTAALIAAAVPVAASPSYYTARLDDTQAVYVTAPAFPVHGDGVADDTAAIQQAIDKVQETTGQGIVFLPQGRYRITKTIQVWPGIRVIGYGASRPTLVLGPNTPGYQDGERFMVFFAGRRPRDGDGDVATPTFSGRGGVNMAVANDSSPGTFYSAMSNIDIEIGEGNPGAVGIRGRYAQHCYLSHMDFHIGSGFAGIHDTGNIAEDLHFYGGQYGIVTQTPSPSWQFTLLDSSFEGQSKAAIKTHDAGLTLIRPQFKRVPTAISTEPNYTEQLWVKDGRFENIIGPALIVSSENAARLQVNMENVACQNVPTFATYRESGKMLAAPGETYVAKTFSHGWHFDEAGKLPQVRTIFDAEKVDATPAPAASDVRPLPPMDTWVNLQSLGAKGDGATDDTAVIRDAIAKYKTIYLPQGKYLVTDTITLRPDTVLIGLNPITTQILIADGTAAFDGVPAAQTPSPYPGAPRFTPPPFPAGPVPLLEAPKDGTNIVTGIGLDTGGNNPAAVGAKWMAGEHSMMDDVKFLGGHGSGVPFNQVYNANHTADGNPNRHWDSEYYSLWITDGGGGTFKNIWSASTYAQAGMAITNTSTPGHIYQMSSEHHVRHEVQLKNVSNWEICALQTEEERGESGFCLPVDIQGCSHITLANLFMYRVISSFQPFPYAVRVADSKDIRLRNVHCYSNSKVCFDDTVFEANKVIRVPDHEFSWLTITGQEKPAKSDQEVKRLAGGFFNISGGAVDPKTGDFYFVDNHWQRIYRWNVAEGALSTVRDNPLDPVNLAFDKAGNLMVVSYTGTGTVYTFNPTAYNEDVTVVKAQPSADRPGMTAFRPVNYWQISDDLASGKPEKNPWQFISPDGTAFILAGDDFINGATAYGIKMNDVIRAFGLAPAVPGKPFYVTDEANAQTYVAHVLPDGTLTNARFFVNNGGESVAVGPDGDVYLAAGKIYIYTPAGKLVQMIDVPERPTQLVFGSKDGQTLFICARTSLYAVQLK
jgi:sugar lactone lactonase YvrE